MSTMSTTLTNPLLLAELDARPLMMIMGFVAILGLAGAVAVIRQKPDRFKVAAVVGVGGCLLWVGLVLLGVGSLLTHSRTVDLTVIRLQAGQALPPIVTDTWGPTLPAGCEPLMYLEFNGYYEVFDLARLRAEGKHIPGPGQTANVRIKLDYDIGSLRKYGVVKLGEAETIGFWKGGRTPPLRDLDQLAKTQSQR